MSQRHSRTASRPHNLPTELTSFVGRRRETAEAKTTRLLTLTGPGGAGKTRLALRVAADLVRAFPDGAWVVELANLLDPALVTQAVFNALGLRDRSAGWPVGVLTQYVAEKQLLDVELAGHGATRGPAQPADDPGHAGARTCRAPGRRE